MQDTDQRWISYGFVFLHIRIIYSYLLKHQALCHETERITELPYILEWSVKRGTITVLIKSLGHVSIRLKKCKGGFN